MSFGRSVLITVFVLALFSVACGGDPPDKEIQQAQDAIDKARAAGADRYAVEEYTAALEALKNAHGAVDQRDYRLALNDALDSRERAENAAKLAVEGKAAAKSAAEKALNGASAAVTAADAKVKAASMAKVPPRSATDARTNLDEAQKHLQEARTALDGGDYYGALSAASLAVQSTKAVTDKLDGPPSAQPRRHP